MGSMITKAKHLRIDLLCDTHNCPQTCIYSAKMDTLHSHHAQDRPFYLYKRGRHHYSRGVWTSNDLPAQQLKIVSVEGNNKNWDTWVEGRGASGKLASWRGNWDRSVKRGKCYFGWRLIVGSWVSAAWRECVMGTCICMRGRRGRDHA